MINKKSKAKLSELLKHAKLEVILIGVAIALGITGATLEHLSRVDFEAQLQSQYRVTTVLVLGQNLKQGTVITKDMLSTRAFLSSNVTPHMIAPKDLELTLGHTLVVDGLAGDPLTLSQLTTGQNMRTIAERIPEGKRLYMLEINDRVAAHGFIRPGDHVDVLGRLDFPGRGLTSFTLLANIQIVSMGKSVDPLDQTITNQVSFFVSPEQMEVLNFAEGEGEFRLSLRNPHDKRRAGSQKGVDREVFLNSDLLYEYADQPVKVTEGQDKNAQRREL